MRKAEFSVRREPIDLADARARGGPRATRARRATSASRWSADAARRRALADADRALQVVSNLVENALRLTPAGGSVRVVAEPGEITVEDTGPGLGPDELDRAFERFYLYSRYGRERPVGTGLGLAIVKELVEGMGGTVEASSVAGPADGFNVRLPRRLPPPPRLTFYARFTFGERAT